MIRKTALGLVAAAATLAAAMGATASSASAGVNISIGFGHGFGYGYYKPYYKPYHYCHKVVVGYDYYGNPIWRCAKRYYHYGY